MQKTFATSILIFIILFAAGCVTQPAQNAPEDNPPQPIERLSFGQRVENAISQSLGGGWRLESIEQTGEMKGWECGNATGARLTLLAPNNYDGDERYTFWVFKPNFGGMSESGEVFYYNRNEEYLLFAAKGSDNKISFLPLNLVAVALGINELSGEIHAITDEHIARVRQDIAAQNRAKANAMNKAMTEVLPTRYNTIIKMNSRDEEITSAIMNAVTTLYPHKTCVILRYDGSKEDCLIINAK